MQLLVKHFTELSNAELYAILQARQAVFVVEQNCPFAEIDGKDLDAYHLWLADENGIAAYARVLDRGISFEEPAVGRVISLRRREVRGKGSHARSPGLCPGTL